ncbi:hypothetical protein [Verminephrobacter aporrectodeae]|uniref:hypothetical protein n=2 Tax=Verminephrobacter aporrectodeae TaxID=1110389 RepID=UPI002237E2CB|nr:hypothetical protein [Verminephrobacter aporrectodeae]
MEKSVFWLCKFWGLKMLSVNKKLFFWILLLMLGPSFLYGIYWFYKLYEFRRFIALESRSFESMLIEKSISNKEVKVSEVIPIGERVCFLPSYKTSESMESSLFKNQMGFLNGKMSDDISNQIWWVIVLSKGKVLETYRTTGRITPIFKKGKCVKQKDSRFLVLFNKDKHTPYFDISEGDPMDVPSTSKQTSRPCSSLSARAYFGVDGRCCINPEPQAC